MPRKRLAVLDDFRAIAIALVVVMHGYRFSFPVVETNNPLLILVFSGATGVGLFFILSGFLVTRPFIEAELENRSASFREYALQRSLRILPLYYLAVFSAVVATGSSDHLIDAVLFNADGFDFGAYSVVWWSLNVEVQFYILVPLLYLASRFIDKRLLLILYMLAWASFFALYSLKLLHLSQATELQLGNSLFSQLHAFLVGFVLSIMYSKKVFFGQKKLALVMVVLFSAILVVSLRARIGVGFGFHAIFPVKALCESILWGVILYGGIIIDKSFLGVIGSFLARISYSLYLVHVPVLFAFIGWRSAQPVADAPSPAVTLVLAMTAAILLSTVLYLLVERPFLNLKDRIRQRRKSHFPDQCLPRS